MKRLQFNHAILDSGPILISLALNYITNTHFSESYKLSFLAKAYDKIEQIDNPLFRLKELFKSIEIFNTSPHVMGEVLGLVRSRLGDYLDSDEKINDFWAKSIEYLTFKSLSEDIFVKIIDLYRDEVSKNLISEIGFVDAELIKIALYQKYPGKNIKSQIITTDRRTLRKEAEKKGINVFVIQDDIYSFE